MDKSLRKRNPLCSGIDFLTEMSIGLVLGEFMFSPDISVIDEVDCIDENAETDDSSLINQLIKPNSQINKGTSSPTWENGSFQLRPHHPGLRRFLSEGGISSL